jgi:AcrR family transcriptional regulator
MSMQSHGYHHGDLRAACLFAGMELLDEGDEEALSLRAVARRAGVSANAPYRHFADKNALLAALATKGFQMLAQSMSEFDSTAPAGEEFVALGQSYVRFALAHPSLFRLMYGHPCTRYSAEAQAAADDSNAVLMARVARLVPESQQMMFAVGSWSLVHGLASLILDGKLILGSREQVDDMVRNIVKTVLEAKVELVDGR